MHEKTAYIRTKVVGPFPRPCTSGSYVHRAALFMKESPGAAVKLLLCDHLVDTGTGIGYVDMLFPKKHQYGDTDTIFLIK
jgi:hypothetical protein